MAIWNDFLPRPDERMFIAGQTGSGKTYLTERLLECLPPDEMVIIIDSKHGWNVKRSWFSKGNKPVLLNQHPIYKRGLALNSLEPGKYVYRPSYPEMLDPMITKLFLWALKRGKITLDIDELGDFSRGPNVHQALGKVIRQGRQKKVRMLIGSQRPASIPLIALTESTKFAVFHLQSLEDRKRMAQWVNPIMINEVDGHDFYFYDVKKKEIKLIHSGE